MTTTDGYYYEGDLKKDTKIWCFKKPINFKERHFKDDLISIYISFTGDFLYNKQVRGSEAWFFVITEIVHAK